MIQSFEQALIFSDKNLLCTGGLIHIVDKVLEIPSPTVQQITKSQLEYFISILNIGGFLQNTSSNYVQAVLQRPDVTYFIPNSPGALEKVQNIVKNASAEDLKSFFQYHVVPGYLGYSSVLKRGGNLTTAQGSNVTISVLGDDMYVNAVKILSPNNLVANGVVHVIGE